MDKEKDRMLFSDMLNHFEVIDNCIATLENETQAGSIPNMIDTFRIKWTDKYSVAVHALECVLKRKLSKRF